jgi:hypothetical protein
VRAQDAVLRRRARCGAGWARRGRRRGARRGRTMALDTRRGSAGWASGRAPCRSKPSVSYCLRDRGTPWLREASGRKGTAGEVEKPSSASSEAAMGLVRIDK